MTDPTGTPNDAPSAETPDAGVASPTTEANPASDDQLQALIAERDDFKDKWARARADLENYRRRMQREMEDDRKYAVLPLLKAVLPGLDGLQLALRAAATSKNADDLITGVDMVARQFDSALANAGIQAITSVGQPFDPNLHEAITQRPSADHPPMTVLDEVERGYLLHDRVVRPSKVIVSSAPQSGLVES